MTVITRSTMQICCLRLGHEKATLFLQCLFEKIFKVMYENEDGKIIKSLGCHFIEVLDLNLSKFTLT